MQEAPRPAADNSASAGRAPGGAHAEPGPPEKAEARARSPCDAAAEGAARQQPAADTAAGVATPLPDLSQALPEGVLLSVISGLDLIDSVSLSSTCRRLQTLVAQRLSSEAGGPSSPAGGARGGSGGGGHGAGARAPPDAGSAAAAIAATLRRASALACAAASGEWREQLLLPAAASAAAAAAAQQQREGEAARLRASEERLCSHAEAAALDSDAAAAAWSDGATIPGLLRALAPPTAAGAGVACAAASATLPQWLRGAALRRVLSAAARLLPFADAGRKEAAALRAAVVAVARAALACGPPEFESALYVLECLRGAESGGLGRLRLANCARSQARGLGGSLRLGRARSLRQRRARTRAAGSRGAFAREPACPRPT